jgi:S-adenosylmethionine:tRNA ribosyltransferase-isomerase
MKTTDFDYHLPPGLIAQFPSEKRDECRLLFLDKSRQSIEHRHFNDLPSILKAGDRLILNDTKVFPARLRCRKDTGASVELLFISCIGRRSWKAMARPAKNARTGLSLYCEKAPSIRLHIDSALPDGTRIVSPERDDSVSIDELLQRYGETPLPPYIKRKTQESDTDSYQTIFARTIGAIASPTAGLHFTESLLQKLKEKDVSLSFLTLHVGIGTFKPVVADDPRDHHMHEERFTVRSDVADAINRTKREGGRNIAVGTTVVRALEHCSMDTGFPVAANGSTRLLILPGFTFKAIDGMITNFHVPRSTLLMLVCAFAGKEFILEAYRRAIDDRYRFFSYGDAMIIL